MVRPLSSGTSVIDAVTTNNDVHKPALHVLYTDRKGGMKGVGMGDLASKGQRKGLGRGVSCP